MLHILFTVNFFHQSIIYYVTAFFAFKFTGVSNITLHSDDAFYCTQFCGISRDIISHWFLFVLHIYFTQTTLESLCIMFYYSCFYLLSESYHSFTHFLLLFFCVRCFIFFRVRFPILYLSHQDFKHFNLCSKIMARLLQSSSFNLIFTRIISIFHNLVGPRLKN